MKLISIMISLAVVTGTCLKADEENINLEQLVYTAKERGMDHSLGAINDNLGVFLDMPAFSRLVAEIEQTPAFFSKKAETKTLTKLEQEMVIIAAWSLPDDKYLQFAQDAVRETKKGRMQWQNLEFVIWPVVGQRTYCVLARHQTEAEFVELVRSVRPIFPQIPYFLNRIDELLAGKARVLPTNESAAEMKHPTDSVSSKNADASAPIAPEAKPTVPTPSEESTSSTPWSIIVVLIVAATGLLWLLLKRRS